MNFSKYLWKGGMGSIKISKYGRLLRRVDTKESKFPKYGRELRKWRVDSEVRSKFISMGGKGAWIRRNPTNSKC